jgi:Domain of unknown function (DUF4174)
MQRKPSTMRDPRHGPFTVFMFDMFYPTRRTSTRAAAAIAASLTVLAPSVGTAQTMSDYMWKKRPIVVFAPSDGDARYVRQKLAITGNRTAFLDRDVVVVYVVGGTVSHDLGAGPGLSAAALRTRFRASEGAFRVLLLGKDGGIKLDSPVTITAVDIFSEIDRMPMRRDEARKRSTTKP